MIEFCRNNKIDELSFLEFIEDGNEKGKNLSLSLEQKIQTLLAISKVDKNVYKNLKIIPKFVRPLSKQFVKVCYDLEMPEITHYCNAGLSFAFIDNYGNILPCDRQRVNSEFVKGNNNLPLNSFTEIWNSDAYDKVFKRVYEKSLYTNVEPCNKCNHLQVDCFPCYIDIIRHNVKIVPECNEYVKYAEKIGVDLFNDKNSRSF